MAAEEPADSSGLIRTAADSVTQLVVGSGPAASNDGDESEDPLVELARLHPAIAASFVKSAMLMGGLSSGFVAVVTGALLAVHWSTWAQCERPLRWWLLANSLIQIVQVPLRIAFWASVRAAEVERQSIALRIAQMASTQAWRASKAISLLAYFWVILGFVWVMNSMGCKTCSSLVATVVAGLATSAFRVLGAFVGFRLHLPHVARDAEAPQMVAATAEQISSLDTVTYESDVLGDAATCAVCLSDFCGGEVLRRLPCNHRFHVDCCDKWLGCSKRCPLCMQNIDEMLKKPDAWSFCRQR